MNPDVSPWDVFKPVGIPTLRTGIPSACDENNRLSLGYFQIGRKSFKNTLSDAGAVRAFALGYVQITVNSRLALGYFRIVRKTILWHRHTFKSLRKQKCGIGILSNRSYVCSVLSSFMKYKMTF